MVTEGNIANDWRCEEQRIVRNVNTARKLEDFTDVTFVIGLDGDSCIIKVHKAVLGTVNKDLAKLVSRSAEIKIPNVSPKGFQNLIRFVYDIDVKFSDLTTVRETYVVAKKYNVYKLKQAAENYINQAAKLNESILEILQIAIELNMPTLRSKCIDIVSTKYQEVLKSEELLSVPLKVVIAVLSIRPCKEENCHYQLLAIGNWMKMHGIYSPGVTRLLLECLDFTRIEMVDFGTFIDEYGGLLSDSDIGAFQKCVITKEINDAPEWYRSTEHARLLNINLDNKTEGTEKDASESSFFYRMEREKLKVQKLVDEEICYIDKIMKEIAASSLEDHKRNLNETVQTIVDGFADLIKEAVETAVESLEDDLNYQMKKNREKGSVGASTNSFSV